MRNNLLKTQVNVHEQQRFVVLEILILEGLNK